MKRIIDAITKKTPVGIYLLSLFPPTVGRGKFVCNLEKPTAEDQRVALLCEAQPIPADGRVLLGGESKNRHHLIPLKAFGEEIVEVPAGN